MGAGRQKDQAIIISLNFQHRLYFSEKREGLEVELIIDHAYIRKPP